MQRTGNQYYKDPTFQRIKGDIANIMVGSASQDAAIELAEKRAAEARLANLKGDFQIGRNKYASELAKSIPYAEALSGQSNLSTTVQALAGQSAYSDKPLQLSQGLSETGRAQSQRKAERILMSPDTGEGSASRTERLGSLAVLGQEPTLATTLTATGQDRMRDDDALIRKLGALKPAVAKPGEKVAYTDIQGNMQTMTGSAIPEKPFSVAVKPGEKVVVYKPNGQKEIIEGSLLPSKPTVVNVKAGEKAVTVDSGGNVVATIDGPPVSKAPTVITAGPGEKTAVVQDGNVVTTLVGIDEKEPAFSGTVGPNEKLVIKKADGSFHEVQGRIVDENTVVKAGPNEKVSVVDSSGNEVFSTSGPSHNQLQTTTVPPNHKVVVMNKDGGVTQTITNPSTEPKFTQIPVKEGESVHLVGPDGNPIKELKGPAPQKSIKDSILPVTTGPNEKTSIIGGDGQVKTTIDGPTPAKSIKDSILPITAGPNEVTGVVDSSGKLVQGSQLTGPTPISDAMLVLGEDETAFAPVEGQDGPTLEMLASTVKAVPAKTYKKKPDEQLYIEGDDGKLELIADATPASKAVEFKLEEGETYFIYNSSDNSTKKFTAPYTEAGKKKKEDKQKKVVFSGAGINAFNNAFDEEVGDESESPLKQLPKEVLRKLKEQLRGRAGRNYQTSKNLDEAITSTLGEMVNLGVTNVTPPGQDNFIPDWAESDLYVPNQILEGAQKLPSDQWERLFKGIGYTDKEVEAIISYLQ